MAGSVASSAPYNVQSGGRWCRNPSSYFCDLAICPATAPQYALATTNSTCPESLKYAYGLNQRTDFLAYGGRPCRPAANDARPARRAGETLAIGAASHVEGRLGRAVVGVAFARWQLGWWHLFTKVDLNDLGFSSGDPRRGAHRLLDHASNGGS